MKNNSNSNKPDELFEKLKNIMIEYCSLQDDSSIDIVSVHCKKTKQTTE